MFDSVRLPLVSSGVSPLTLQTLTLQFTCALRGRLYSDALLQIYSLVAGEESDEWQKEFQVQSWRLLPDTCTIAVAKSACSES